MCGYAAVARMEGELTDIEALKDLKIELISQKEVRLGKRSACFNNCLMILTSIFMKN